MILSTLRTNVAAELGLDNTAGSSDQILIDGWLNQGIRDVLLKTHCYVESAALTLTVGASDYAMDAQILAVIHASAADGRLEQITSDELFERRRQNSDVTGETRYYALLGANLLLIHPGPSSASTLTFYYVPRPTEMSAAGNDPATATYGGIPLEFQHAIELYAFWQGATFDNNKESRFGESYHRDYELFLTKTIRTAINRKGGIRQPRAQVGRGRALVRARNDTY